MLNQNVLDKVKVKKEELLQTMTANREAHKETIESLLVQRNREARAYFADLAERLENDETLQAKENIKFPLPKNNTASYDRAIKMVEMSVEDEIELTESQFDKLVMDNWEWKNDLLTTSAFYGKG